MKKAKAKLAGKSKTEKAKAGKTEEMHGCGCC